MLEAIIKHLKHDKHGISNVIVVMLSLILIVVIVANVVLWSYQMNQFDWEKKQENIAIANVTPFREIWSFNPSEYVLGGLTGWLSGDVSDLTSDDGAYMSFRSYYSGTDTLDFVDGTCDLYPPPAKGTDSNFSALQTGPNGICDTLKEENTAGGWKVQSGTGSIGSGNTYTLVDINPVNLSKAFIIIRYGGSINYNENPSDVIISGNFSSSSQLRFDREGTTNAGNFGWYVIEALGAQISVQSGTTELGFFETQKDVTISNVSDTNKCVAFLSRRSDGWSGSYYAESFVTGELTSTTNLRLRREGSGVSTVTVEWFVVKFNNGTTIQTSESAVASNPTIQSISSVNLSRSWLYFTWRCTHNGLAQVSPRGWLKNSTEIRWYRQTSTGTCYCRWFVIQMPSGMSVQRGYHDSTVNSEYIKDITISPVELSRTFSFITNDCTGTGTAFPRPFWIERITDATNLHLERWRIGQTCDHNWQIIELPSPNFELDLEVQWTNADYNKTNEELCIYGGTMGSEDVHVDAWNGSAWENLFTDLSSGWNNVSVSSYLESSTFTIRFKDGAETGDITQDSWNIDVIILHVWSDEYASEVEFTGSSSMEDWSQLTWTVNNAWTTGSVNVMLQIYNYTLDGYPTSGNGYMVYISVDTPNTDENKSQTININPTHFRNATGYWKMRVKGVKATGTQFDFKADWIEFEPVKISGTTFIFKNEGSQTAHLVSLWIINLTVHQHYDMDIFVNSGETLSHTRDDLYLPSEQYLVKIVTMRGNIAVHSNK